MTTCAAAKHDTLTAYCDHRCRCPLAREAKRQAHRRSITGKSRWRNHHHVDTAAVYRAIVGDLGGIRLGAAERALVVAELTRRGRSARQIADQIGVSSRAVQRHRAAQRAKGALR